jgi:hypothetical protein
MDVLHKSGNLGKVFLAGEYWSGGMELQNLALELGYGILYENGNDLTVIPPKNTGTEFPEF